MYVANNDILSDNNSQCCASMHTYSKYATSKWQIKCRGCAKKVTLVPLSIHYFWYCWGAPAPKKPDIKERLILLNCLMGLGWTHISILALQSLTFYADSSKLTHLPLEWGKAVKFTFN